MTEGEVVVARFLREHGAVVLSLLDVDDDAGVEEAPALLTGGTRWLLPGRHLTDQPASGRTFPAEGSGAPRATATGAGERDGGSAATPVPAPKASAALMTAQLSWKRNGGRWQPCRSWVAAASQVGARLVSIQQEHDVLRAELDAEKQIAEAAGAALEDARPARPEAGRAPRSPGLQTPDAARAQACSGRRLGGAVPDKGERLRHDVYLAWAKNVPACDKARLQLPAGWTAGRRLAVPLYGFTEPGVVGKALKATVEILTGVAERKPRGKSMRCGPAGAAARPRWSARTVRNASARQ